MPATYTTSDCDPVIAVWASCGAPASCWGMRASLRWVGSSPGANVAPEGERWLSHATLARTPQDEHGGRPHIGQFSRRAGSCSVIRHPQLHDSERFTF